MPDTRRRRSRVSRAAAHPSPAARSHPAAGMGQAALALLGFAGLTVALPARAGVGGGYANTGITGQFFPNQSFSGSPAFTRKDVRLDFGTSVSLSPAGVGQTGEPGWSAIGAGNWSAIWSGQVIPRFSETYTFKSFADDTLVLKLRPSGSSNWTTVISQPGYTGADSVGTFPMTAGQKYDIEVDFTQAGGPWGLNLRWSSPSTPEEVIDTVDHVGINNPDTTAMYADLMKGGRGGYENTGWDANGWPTGDGDFVFQETLNQGLDTDPLMDGTVHFSFTGKADVSIQGNDGNLQYAYDSGTNTTTGTFQILNNGWNAGYFKWRNSRRLPSDTTNTGITNIRLWRPTAPNATTSYAPGTIFIPQMRDALSHYSVMRFQMVANTGEKNWTDRARPGYFSQANPSWEYKVLLANETGRDLMLSIPVNATDDYITQLARLLKYGSDGVNPYTSPQTNPVYPPLNPNLKVHLELENELWNWSGVFGNDFGAINAMVDAHKAANDADWQAMTYDGVTDGNLHYRESILRAVQISNLFRAVWGDAFMPGTSADPTVRPLYEWQYDDANGTASQALTWADHWFNNSDGGSHVASPHPVSYFLWGGGGANYYGSNNGEGLTDILADSNFASPSVGAGYIQAPGGGPWSFSGTAGIARPNGADIPPAYSGSQVGYIAENGSASISFTIPSSQISNIYAISFRAVNRLKSGASAADTENIRVYLDGQDVTAKSFSQGNGYTPPDYNDIGWDSRVVFWTNSPYYFTKSFTASPGSTHTLTITGQNAAGSNQALFLGDVRVTSVDALYAGGMPGSGEANGQPAGQNLFNTMKVEANWAKAFGLKQLSYESGWSLGGDNGGSWLQLAAKYGDSRTADAEKKALDFFYQAGNDVEVHGTYQQWPSWGDYYAQQGLLNVAQYPLVQGVDQYANQLPAEAVNGNAIPATLPTSSATLAWGFGNGTVYAGGWLSWNVLVPATGVYNVSTDAGGGGTQQVWADGALLGSGPSANAVTQTPYQVTLTKGMHVFRVACTSGAFGIGKLFVNAGAAPATGVALETFDFAGKNGDEASDAPTSFAPGVSGSSITRGSGYAASSTQAGGGFGVYPPSNVYPNSAAQAVVTGQNYSGEYYQFSTTAPSGKGMNLKSVAIAGFGQNETPGMLLQYSTDGTNFTTVGSIDGSSSNGNTPTLRTFDLSGIAALQNFGGTVTFRIYQYGIGGYEFSGIGKYAGNDIVVYGSVGSPSGTGAFHGPHAVPGTLEAEDYDTGGEGVAYHVTGGGGQTGYRADNNGDLEPGGSTSNGYDLGWTTGGQWTRYTVNVSAAGHYRADFSVASPSGAGGAFHLEDASGKNLTGSVNVPNTGGWYTWQTASAALDLPAGPQMIRLVQDAGGWNIDKTVFSQAALPTTLNINAGGGAVGSFVADTDFSGGAADGGGAGHAIDTSGVTNPAPQEVYQSNRYNSATYTIPVNPPDPGASYTVKLHFCDIFDTAAGQRVFNVSINGANVLSNFDVIAVAGARYKALVETFTGIQPVNGQITVQTQNGSADLAILNGIEVSDPPAATAAPAAPSGVRGYGTSKGVSLTWAAVSGATSYSVYRATASGKETLVKSGLTGTFFADTGLVSGTAYYYKAAAVNAKGTSALSSEVKISAK